MIVTTVTTRRNKHSLDFFFYVALSEHDDPAQQLPEGDAALGAAAGLVQPLRHLEGNTIA